MSEEPWKVSLSDEVADWYRAVDDRAKARVDQAINRLQTEGSRLREPHSKSLGQGLFELRFKIQKVPVRLTYHIYGRTARILTVFHKQRHNERHEVTKARERMGRDRVELASHTRSGRGSDGNSRSRADAVARRARGLGQSAKTRSSRGTSGLQRSDETTRRRGRAR